MEYEGAVQPKALLPDGWVAFADEDGAEYYFSPETGLGAFECGDSLKDTCREIK